MVAVMAVVLYHLWPRRLTGGFVGVDVFFVISGYLITGHVFREIVRTSRLSVIKFWARRVRRLLPAAFVVLILSLVAVYLWVPETLWESTAQQVMASAAYVQNWVLAGDSVNYSALNEDATVAQHYWSLSIEEQFYVFWPLLIVALLWFAKVFLPKSSPARVSARALLIAGLSVVALASLAYSIFETETNPAAAYFVTPTRVWEFAAGALVALVFVDRQFTGALATVLAWLGLGGIVASAILYSSQTLFPGYTALLPVLGTALLLCCAPMNVFSPSRWLSSKPATFVGDISYALYLWHWPLIVVAPFALAADLNWALKMGILALSVILAWLTKILIEDPFRKGTLLAGTVRTYVFMVVGAATVVAMSLGLITAANSPSSAAQMPTGSACYGPGSLAHPKDCSVPMGKDEPSPAALAVFKENKNVPFGKCQASFAGSELVSCDIGVDSDSARQTVAMVGDSHATAWLPAMDIMAKKYGWHVITYIKASCPVSNALRVLPSEKTSENQDDCHAWGQKVNTALESNKTISTVFTASFSSAYSYKSLPQTPLTNAAVDGFTTMWAGWQRAGKKVAVFDDVPRTNGQYIPTCLSENPNDPMKCALPKAQAIPSTMAITRAAEQASKDGITRIELSKFFCDARWCYPVVGSVIVYRDYPHLSVEYSKALVPYIEPQIQFLTGAK